MSDLLYSPPSSNADLKCLNSSGGSIACPNGVCRAHFNLYNRMVRSSCFELKSGYKPYGVNLAQGLSSYINLKFTCNKPLCNSKETTDQVLKILASANIMPESLANINKMYN